LRSNASRILGLLLLLLAGGCGGSKEAASPGAAGPSFKEFLAEGERSFQPSRYDPPIESLKTENRIFGDALPKPDVAPPAVAETIAGFRVQVLLTQDIDQAAGVRLTIAGSLPEEWVYLVYDLPYYKVRVGNYADRESANQSVRRLVAMGYADAWVVPDKVLRNPPPPPVPALPDSAGK
jgi:hypothetical protein